MKNLGIRVQLALAFGGVTALLVIVAAISIINFQKQYEMFNSYVNGTRARSEEAHLVREAIDLRAVAARNLVLVTTPAEREKEKAVAVQAHAEVQTHLRTLKTLAERPDASETTRELIRNIDTIEHRYAPVALSIVELGYAGRSEEAIRKMNEECRPLLAELVAASNAYAARATERSAALIRESEESYDYARNLMLVTSAAAVLMAVVAATLIVSSLLKSLGAEPAVLCAVVERVAGGDFTQQVAVHPQDQRSILAAVARMQSSLIRVVADVRKDAQAVSLAAAEISQGNLDLSSRTERQAGSLEETASSMEELTATVRQNAENAAAANTLATRASGVATASGTAVGRVIDTMEAISTASHKIVDIIGVIEGIAFQTNILALNAAVESARAGEQGRGFGVVASEVRNLAHRSAAAAKEIKLLIDDTVAKVSEGTGLAADAGATMTQAVDSVTQVCKVIAEITAASQEQSQGIAQVNHAIAAMDDVTQQNASLVEEAAAAAQSLNDQAANLVATMSVFRLELGVEHAPAPQARRARPPVLRLAQA